MRRSVISTVSCCLALYWTQALPPTIPTVDLAANTDSQDETIHEGLAKSLLSIANTFIGLNSGTESISASVLTPESIGIGIGGIEVLLHHEQV